MATVTTYTGDVRINGNLSLTGSLLPGLVRSSFRQEDLAVYPVPFENLRVWNAYETTLPGTAASDDLGLYGGTFATASQLVRTQDVKTLTTTLYARFRVILPVEYVAAQTVQLRFSAGMVTTDADGTATIDLQAYQVDREGGISADLCTTAALDINVVGFADKDFTITATALSPGDVLDCRVAIAVVDTSTVTAVIGAIGAIELLCDIKG